MVLFFMTVFGCMLGASSYIGRNGTWNGQEVILRVHQGDIFNVRRDSATGRVRHLHFTRSSVTIIAQKGYLIKKGSLARFMGREKVFTGHCGDRKGYFRKSEYIESRGYVRTLRLVATLLDKKSGREFIIDKVFRVQIDFSSKSSRGYSGRKLKVTPQ